MNIQNKLGNINVDHRPSYLKLNNNYIEKGYNAQVVDFYFC